LNFDKRLTPARPDLAAESLRGQVMAASYATGRRMQVRVSHVNVQRKPSDDAPTDTQALNGETLMAYEERGGWCWVQLERDRYVGYICAEALTENIVKPSHRVCARHTMIYSAPDIKSPPLDALPFGAEVHILAADGAFSQTGSGYIFSRHLAPNDRPLGEFVGLAEIFLHTPYLWGGKTDMGIDCSGLAQVALAAAGVDAPRDTDMMEAALGRPVDVDGNLRGLRRGDLVFWRGHVGVMQSEDLLLHANAHFMMVTSEPLIVARDRIRRNASSEITSVRRIYEQSGEIKPQPQQ
jgi:cell wall-associated NlpC family hydrolase